MVEARPFRFGLQVATAASRQAWVDAARHAEDVGFDVLLVPDHVNDAVMSPIAALVSAAEATTTLRVGTLVLNNDLRYPAVLAREAAMVDLLSDGRLELGLGAGHAEPEYHQVGVPFDPPAIRVARLEQSVDIILGLFSGQTVTVDGPHYTLHGDRLDEARRPRLLVGGNGDRLLRLAATRADIVGFTGLGRTLRDGQHHETRWATEQVDHTVEIVRVAAGPRLRELELNVLVQHVEITDDRRRTLDLISDRLGLDPTVTASAPFLLVGTRDQVVEQLRAARQRWGFSYFATRDPDATAPIIDSLRSR